MTENDPNSCKHRWSTKYSSRLGVEGIEWFCVHCRRNLDWPTVHKWVNAHTDLLEACKLTAAIVIDCYDACDTPLNEAWKASMKAVRKAEEQMR